jgi:hypothetical protein
MISSIGSSLPCYGQSQAQSGTAGVSQTEDCLPRSTVMAMGASANPS